MYRINLYPEREERRHRARLRMGRIVFVAVLAGLGTLSILALGVNGFLLRDRVAAIRAGNARLAANLSPQGEAGADLVAARALLSARLARVDWSPVLGAIADRIGPGLIVTEMSGVRGSKNEPRSLTFSGQIRGSGGDMQAVTAFVDSLRADARITSVFGSVVLDNLEGGRFRIVCAASGEGS